MAQEEIYIGIDLGDAWTQISYYRPDMEDAETVSTVVGEERYRIPTVSYRKQENGEELLGRFLRKVICLVPGITEPREASAVTFHLPHICMEDISRLKRLMEQMEIPVERVFFQDDKESFCHFALNQKKELALHDMVLFRCEENALSCLYLTRGGKSTPQKIEITARTLGQLPEDAGERDRYFAEAATEVLTGKIVSSIYLTGEGLEGGWLAESLTILCRGRKVFQGRNLYTRGACFESFMQMHKEKCSYIFLNEYKLAKNIMLQVKQQDRTFFKELAEAGNYCYEVNGSCEVLLSGEPFVDIWLKAPDSNLARVESLELTGLPKRPDKATRLLVEAVPSGVTQVVIRITDLGFGPWYASSGKVWEYCIDE